MFFAARVAFAGGLLGLFAMALSALAQETPKSPAGTDSAPAASAASPKKLALTGPVSDQAKTDSGEPSAEQVFAAFGLSSGALITLDVPEEPEIAFSTALAVDGEFLTLDLWPHSNRSPAYQVLAQMADGSLVPQAPGPVRTLRGLVAEIEGSRVAASLSDEGLTATIRLPDQSRFMIEPLQSKFAAADRSLHVVFHDFEVIASDGTCGNELDIAPEESAPPLPAGPRGAACGTGLCFAELACDADNEYFDDYGSVTNVENRINAVINAVNDEYEAEVEITHVITAIVVRTTEPDPYTDFDSGDLLCEFINEWSDTPELQNLFWDVAKLFTGKEINGSTIGQAATIGDICDRNGGCTFDGAMCYSQNDCCGGGSLSCASDLAAHELGHLWGAFHCNPCAGTTMHTPLQCANTFAAISVSQITSHRDSVGCLSSAGGGFVLPFSDDFPSTTLDTAKWAEITGAASNTLGSGEPSPPNSLNIDFNDSITSTFMNTSNLPNGTISYWWQRTGNGDSPEAGDDLFVEYLNNINVWTVLTTHPGAGPDTDPFVQATLPIPADGQHSFFRIRFRGVGTQAGGDDWFVDDILIETGDIMAPLPNPMTFAFLPPTTLSDTEIFMQGTTAVDDLGGVEYQFVKTAGAACCGGSSAWQPGTTFTATGLRANSAYSYKVKARDTATPVPNETSLSTLAASNSTFIEVPFDIQLVDAQETQLTVMVTCQDTGLTNRCNGGAFTDLGLLPSGIFLDMIPLEGSGSNAWVNTQMITMTGLTPGTTYTLKAKARNRVAVETPFSADFMFSTLGVPTGACCFGDGSCAVDSEPACTGGGGIYQGDDTVCTPNPCPQPTGACCFGDGSCVVDTQADCMTADGAYEGDDTVCTPNPCPQPTGACCFGDGSCLVITQAACETASVFYQGDGTVCTPNPCPQPCAMAGDMNQDGSVNGVDVSGYVRAKLGLAAEAGENQSCADFGTGTLDGDTQAFVAVLLN